MRAELATEHNESELESSQELPGGILKKNRESLGLSRSNIAMKLNLSEKVIASLEQDQYDNLPGKTFVKGYIRNYARFLNICADELIAGFDKIGVAPEGRAKGLINIRRQVKPGDPLVKWATLVIVLSLLALSTVWWRSHSDSTATGYQSVPGVSAPNTELTSSKRLKPN